MTFCFILFWQNDIRANDVSGKRRSAERRFVKMTFGWTMIRENDVRLNNNSEKCRSALWSFTNSTIRPCNDSVKWLSEIFFRQNNDSAKLHFGETTIWWNDVSEKWCGLYLMFMETSASSSQRPRLWRLAARWPIDDAFPQANVHWPPYETFRAFLCEGHFGTEVYRVDRKAYFMISLSNCNFWLFDKSRWWWSWSIFNSVRNVDGIGTVDMWSVWQWWIGQSPGKFRDAIVGEEIRRECKFRRRMGGCRTRSKRGCGRR